MAKKTLSNTPRLIHIGSRESVERFMRVDHQLLSAILAQVERAPAPELLRLAAAPPGGAARLRWHTQLLIDQGCLTAQQLRRYGPPVAVSLTLAGQDYLDRQRQAQRGPRLRRLLRLWLGRLVTGFVLAKAEALGLPLGLPL